MSSSAEISDGGFSPDTDGVNLTAVPGVIYAPALPTDKSTNATGNIIASCEDPSGNYQRILLSSDTTDDGQLYSADGDGDLTVRGSEDATQNYVQGRADIVAYKGEVYFTSNEYVGRYSSIGSSNTVAPQFFLFNSALVPHPALVYEDNVYYGDGNLLRRQTTAGGAPATILTLSTGQIILALGIDPGSGKMLVSYVSQLNLSGTINTQSRVGFYDGQSDKLDRSVIVEEQITAFPVAEGVQYASYGRNLGYWNGSGVSFLRSFPSIAYDNTELLYKHHFTSIGSTLYFIDNLQIIAHGHITQGGPKVFWPVFKNLVNSNNLTYVSNLGNDLLSFSYATSQHFTVSVTSVASTNTMVFFTNWFRFPRPIEIRSAFLEFSDAITSGVTPGVLTFNNRAYHGSTGALLSFTSLASSTGGATRETVIPIVPQIGNQATTGAQPTRGRSFRFRFATDTVNIGAARIIIYYDPVE